MADRVRKTLEEMVPELEALEQKGYFSKQEIRSIIQKRQNFEYNLQRRAALKKDYERYIEYEISLERLRKLRKKQRSIDSKSSLAEHCVVRRTHRIYERMLKKFKGDLELWNQWISFCQISRSSRHMSQVLTRALQLHPTCSGLWTYAAVWEFEHNHNASAARILMQKGIRMCKNEKVLWVEYFRMELLYAARLAARRSVLGLDENSLDEATKTLLSGEVAKVVYSNAVSVVENDPLFRMKMLEVLEGIPVLDKRSLELFIVNDINESFSSNPNVCRMLAERRLKEQLQDGAGVIEAMPSCLDCFDHGVENECSTELYKQQMLFLEDEARRYMAEENGTVVQYLLNEYIKCATGALEKGFADSTMILGASRAARRMGDYGTSLDLLCQGPNSRLVEMERVSLLQFFDALHIRDTKILDTAPRPSSLSNSNHSRLWMSVLQSTQDSPDNRKEIANAFLKHQLASVTTIAFSEMGEVGAAIMESLFYHEGISEARKFYREILKIPVPGTNFIESILRMEHALHDASSQDTLSIDDMRKIYDASLDVFGATSINLWLMYYQFEIRQGKQGKSGVVYWKALQALQDADAFTNQAQLLASGTCDAFPKW
eukprot:jgi/Picsp_1/4222/NSC_01731-R1_protein